MGINLRENERVCRSLGEALLDGKGGLSVIPELIVRIIEEGMWRKREVKGLGKVVEFNHFEEFVNAQPLEGIGSTVPMVRNFCRDRPKALLLIDQATGHNQGRRTDLLDNIQEVEEAPTGTSKQRALRKLGKDAPELLQEVLAGEKSAHRAMVEAGFRKEPTPLILTQRAWKRANETERKEIVEWIEGRIL